LLSIPEIELAYVRFSSFEEEYPRYEVEVVARIT